MLVETRGNFFLQTPCVKIDGDNEFNLIKTTVHGYLLIGCLKAILIWCLDIRPHRRLALPVAYAHVPPDRPTHPLENFAPGDSLLLQTFAF